MQIYKYHGLGNDFLLVQGAAHEISSAYIQKICHRRFGIGADGLIQLIKEDSGGFRMHFFNSDASRAAFCGNAMRVCFLHINKMQTKIRCDAGVISGKLEGQSVHVKVPEPQFVKSEKFKQSLSYDHYRCGVDHALFFVDELVKDLDLARRLRMISNCNVSFIKRKDLAIFEMLTFERGVEDFTMACGSAAACLAKKILEKGSVLHVKMPGGTLTYYRNELNELWMSGEAKRVACIQVDENF